MAQAGDYRAGVGNSRIDALTGIGNRRSYDEALAAELSRSRRRDGNVALLLLLDLDGFAALNEQAGQEAGDEALREVVRILSGGRLSDAAFRLEEDAFAMVLPGTDEEGATAAGKRIAARIAGSVLGGNRVRASWGVAAGEPSAEQLHEKAERRLREMKAAAPAG